MLAGKRKFKATSDITRVGKFEPTLVVLGRPFELYFPTIRGGEQDLIMDI